MKLSNLARPALTPFNPFHPHQFHQAVIVSVRDGENVESKMLFVSCPDTGLTPDLMNAFLVSDMGVDERFDSTGLGGGWYWKECQEGAVKAEVSIAEVYANSDPVLLEYRRYNLDMFYPSLYIDDQKTIHAGRLAMAIIETLDPVVGKYFAVSPELLDSDQEENETSAKANDRYKCARAEAFESIYGIEMVDSTDEQDLIIDAADALVISYFQKLIGM